MGDSDGANSYSKSAIGHRALFETLGKLGREALRADADPLGKLGDNGVLRLTSGHNVDCYRATQNGVDLGLVATACDGVVMVVRSNATPSDLARRAREEFPDKLLLGVVLNGIPSGDMAQTKYYYGEAVSSHA